MVINMAREHIIIAMVINILDSGLKTKRMETVFFNMLLEQFMMDNGLMIRHQIRERLFIPIKISMKVIS